jgi:hypothetical protein
MRRLLCRPPCFLRLIPEAHLSVEPLREECKAGCEEAAEQALLARLRRRASLKRVDSLLVEPVSACAPTRARRAVSRRGMLGGACGPPPPPRERNALRATHLPKSMSPPLMLPSGWPIACTAHTVRLAPRPASETAGCVSSSLRSPRALLAREGAGERRACVSSHRRYSVVIWMQQEYAWVRADGHAARTTWAVRSGRAATRRAA